MTVGLLIGTERAVWLLASWLVRTPRTWSVRLPVVGTAPVRAVLCMLVGTIDVHVAPERGPPSSSCTVRLVA